MTVILRDSFPRFESVNDSGGVRENFGIEITLLIILDDRQRQHSREEEDQKWREAPARFGGNRSQIKFARSFRREPLSD